MSIIWYYTNRISTTCSTCSSRSSFTNSEDEYTDSEDENSDDNDDSDDSDDSDDNIKATIYNFPVNIICLEHLENALDSLIFQNKDLDSGIFWKALH